MKDLSYAQETLSREQALRYHLTTNFFPSIPDFVQDEFVNVFQEYWNGDLDVSELDGTLAERAWYTGGINNYDFWQFLDPEDLTSE